MFGYEQDTPDFLVHIVAWKILCALYKPDKQFNKNTKLWQQNGRCLDDV